MEKRVFELLKCISDGANDNPKMVNGLFGKIIVDEVNSILEKEKTKFEFGEKEFKIFTAAGQYVVDEDDQEDLKYEGLKEIRTFEEIGKSIMRAGCYEKKIQKEGSEKTCQYNVTVIFNMEKP